MWQGTKDLRHVAPIAEDEHNDDKFRTLSSVAWQRDKRKWVDTPWTILFGALYITFVFASVVIISSAHFRYSFDSTFSSQDTISQYYKDDVASCCAEVRSLTDNSKARMHSYSSLCHRMDMTEGRKLQSVQGKFIGDDGLFEAFEKRPDIVIGHIVATCILSMFWMLFLWRFANVTIFVIEWTKSLVLLGVFLLVTVTGSPLGLIGILATLYFTNYLVRRRKQDLEHGASVINYATTAFKDSWRSLVGLIAVKLCYIAQVCIFILAFVLHFEIVDVVKRENTYMEPGYYNQSEDNATDYNSTIVVTHLSCGFESKPFVRPVMVMQAIAFVFTIKIFDQIRLCATALIIGSWRFHPESQPTILQALHVALTSSSGSLSSAAIVTSISESFQKRNRSWLCWIGPQAFFIVPLHCIMCCCGCIHNIVRLFTRFSVILHAFNGNSLYTSAIKCHATMRRRFVNGYIFDYSTESIISTSGYVLGTILTFGAWAYIDAAFECSSLNYSMSMTLMWTLLLIVALSCPLIGFFGVLVINHVSTASLRRYSELNEDGVGEFSHLWVPPLAAIFLGVVYNLCFDFIGGIIKDSVDVLFLCLAIDEDNGITRNQGENDFDSIVKKMPEFIVAIPVQELDPESPIAMGVIVGELPHGEEADIDLNQNEWIVAVTRKEEKMNKR